MWVKPINIERVFKRLCTAPKHERRHACYLNRYNIAEISRWLSNNHVIWKKCELYYLSRLLFQHYRHRMIYMFFVLYSSNEMFIHFSCLLNKEAWFLQTIGFTFTFRVGLVDQAVWDPALLFLKPYSINLFQFFPSGESNVSESRLCMTTIRIRAVGCARLNYNLGAL